MKIRSVEPTADIPVFSNNKNEINEMEDLKMRIIVKNEDNSIPIIKINEINKNCPRYIMQLNILDINPEKIYDYVSAFCEKCYIRLLLLNIVLIQKFIIMMKYLMVSFFVKIVKINVN